MFTKKETASPEAFAAPAAPAKRSAMKSKAPSILSSDLSVSGSIVSEGEVQLDGAVEGDVRAGQLTVGEEASVKGEVIAESAIIRGRVEGSIRARQVQLAATARVEGDVIHASLAIESGAYFDGHCRRSSDPLSDSAKSGAAASTGQASGSKAAAAAPPPSSKSSDLGAASKPAAGSGDAFAAAKKS